MADQPAPIIVSALFDAADFSWLNDLRRTHFPPERNIVPAHLTLFHHLAPSLVDELGVRLRAETRGVKPPVAQLSAVLNLGGGVAFRIDSPGLVAIRARLADAFATMLTSQDAAGWRAHVTIQNKVSAAHARETQATLAADFRPRTIAITGLATWYYRGGPWEPIAHYRFR